MNNDEKNILNDVVVGDNNNTSENYNLLLEKLQNSYKLEKDKLESIIKDQEKNISYLKADIENIKRNSLKEIHNSVNKQIGKMLNSFLLIFDDYQRSIEYAEKHFNKDIMDGLMITYNAFYKFLNDFHVVEINTDGIFNPELHEAISSINDSSKEPNSIAQVVQKGFMYKNQVLRIAKVIIFS